MCYLDAQTAPPIQIKGQQHVTKGVSIEFQKEEWGSSTHANMIETVPTTRVSRSKTAANGSAGGVRNAARFFPNYTRQLTLAHV